MEASNQGKKGGCQNLMTQYSQCATNVSYWKHVDDAAMPYYIEYNTKNILPD